MSSIYGVHSYQKLDKNLFHSFLVIKVWSVSMFVNSAKKYNLMNPSSENIKWLSSIYEFEDILMTKFRFLASMILSDVYIQHYSRQF